MATSGSLSINNIHSVIWNVQSSNHHFIHQHRYTILFNQHIQELCLPDIQVCLCKEGEAVGCLFNSNGREYDEAIHSTARTSVE